MRTTPPHIAQGDGSIESSTPLAEDLALGAPIESRGTDSAVSMEGGKPSGEADVGASDDAWAGEICTDVPIAS